MVFSSITFLFYFLPIVLLVYFLTPKRCRNGVLLLASLVFYAWGEPKYVFLMLGSTVLNYTLGNCMGRYRSKAKLLLTASVAVNLSLLVFFKYANLLVDTLQQLGSGSFAFPQIALPIGISFYTFQIMSYTIDVYRRKVEPQKNFIDFAAYVTLFPQLIAGPIVRYATVEKELRERKPDIDSGIILFLIGLSQKVLLANNMGLIWEEVRLKDFSTLSLTASWLGIIAYAFQIYFDFCGYSNMALGLGRMFGFHFSTNFNKPYTSRSITEFWTRWHISLSIWFKEYVYIPLGGNRKGLLLQLRNILIVWLLTGLWHGAGWNFLFWGLYFALLLILEKLFLKKWLLHLPKLLQHGYALFLILIGWVFFVLESPEQINGFLASLFRITTPVDQQTFFILANNGILFFICILASSQTGERILYYLKKKCRRFFPLVQTIALTLLFLLSIAYIVDSSYNPFLYFRF